jgi:hypothetical protein
VADILFQGEGWRIVRLVLEPKRREGPEDTGVRDWIEVADGVDLMGVTRWTQLEKRSAGVSDYARVVSAMKHELLKRLETA